MLYFRGIGQCALVVGEMRLSPASETLFGLAVYLVVEAGRTIPRTELTELLWPSIREDRTGHRLRQLVYRLNQAGAGLRCDRGTVELPRDRVDSDVARLKEHIRDATLHTLLEEEDAYGAFLPGFEPRFSESYALWLERQRDFVARSLTHALSKGLSLARDRGDWRVAETLAVRCLRLDPLNEEATLTLAEAAATTGSKSRALSILSRYIDELGPSAEDLARPVTLLRQRIADWHRSQQTADGPLPVVGREEELAELFRQLSATEAGLGSAVIVSGEQGVGKSRLISELIARAAIRNDAVVRSTCEPHDRRRVLAAVTDLTTALLDTPGSLGSSPDALAQLRRLVTQQLKPMESPEDSELVASLLRSAFLDLLDSVCAEAPLVVVIEDAQWLDTTSQLFLLRSARELLARRILLVLTTRDRRTAAELLDTFPNSPPHIQLGPLHSDASTSLVTNVLAKIGRKEAPAFIDWCVAYAGGNPLYLVQLAAHATSSRGRFSPPASLRSLLTDRLAHLSVTAKGLLRACCVLGRHASFKRLEALLGEKRASFIAAIDELERAGFTATHAGGMSYRHELLARVVLDDLTPSARRTLHEHAAEVLEDDPSVLGTNTLWECARHWEEAGRPDKAVARLRKCAQLSLSMGVPTEAASMFAHAFDLAQNLPDRAEILHERCVALQLADRWDDVAATISQFDQWSLATHAPFALHSDLGTLRLEAGWHTGQPFAELLPDAIRSATSLAVGVRCRLRATALAMILADNLCDVRGVPELYQIVADTLTEEDRALRAWHYVRMIYHAAFGLHAEVQSATSDLIAVASKAENPATLTRCLRHAAIAMSISTSIADAIALATEAHAVAEAARLQSAVAASSTTLSSLYLRLDRMEEAAHWYSRACDQSSKSISPMASTVQLGIGARLAIFNGDYSKARDLISDIQRIVLNTGSLRASAELTAMRAEIGLLEGAPPPPMSQIGDLERLHLRARAFSGHDYFVRVMLEALCRSGLADRAEKLAVEYFDCFRREATEASPRLYSSVSGSQRRVAEVAVRRHTQLGRGEPSAAAPTL